MHSNTVNLILNFMVIYVLLVHIVEFVLDNYWYMILVYYVHLLQYQLNGYWCFIFTPFTTVIGCDIGFKSDSCCCYEFLLFCAMHCTFNTFMLSNIWKSCDGINNVIY